MAIPQSGLAVKKILTSPANNALRARIGSLLKRLENGGENRCTIVTLTASVVGCSGSREVQCQETPSQWPDLCAMLRILGKGEI